ncbi:MAG: hypothetical protein AMXMBFR79_16510 [Chitinophagaceae bacterium]
MKKQLPIIISVFLILFGVVTIFIGSSTLLDFFQIREKQGNYVAFIVRANVICGFFYLIAAIGIFKKQQWALNFLIAASILLIITFIAFLIHIKSGKVYEIKTIYALSFRTIITIAISIITYSFFIKKRK